MKRIAAALIALAATFGLAAGASTTLAASEDGQVLAKITRSVDWT